MSKPEFETLEDVEKLFEDVVHGLKRMAKHFGNDAEEAGDALAKTAAQLARATAELAEEARKESVDLAQRAGKEAKEHPATTAAIAAAAVALIGFAMTRKAAAAVDKAV